MSKSISYTTFRGDILRRNICYHAGTPVNMYMKMSVKSPSHRMISFMEDELQFLVQYFFWKNVLKLNNNISFPIVFILYI